MVKCASVNSFRCANHGNRGRNECYYHASVQEGQLAPYALTEHAGEMLCPPCCAYHPAPHTLLLKDAPVDGRKGNPGTWNLVGHRSAIFFCWVRRSTDAMYTVSYRSASGRTTILFRWRAEADDLSLINPPSSRMPSCRVRYQAGANLRAKHHIFGTRSMRPMAKSGALGEVRRTGGQCPMRNNPSEL